MKLFKRKIKEVKEPETTIVTKFDIRFKTVDGEEHIFTKAKYCDEYTINCSGLEYYCLDMEFMNDDDGAIYPMKNIIKIEAINIRTYKAVKIYYGMGTYKKWYDENEIIGEVEN